LNVEKGADGNCAARWRITPTRERPQGQYRRRPGTATRGGGKENTLGSRRIVGQVVETFRKWVILLKASLGECGKDTGKAG